LRRKIKMKCIEVYEAKIKATVLKTGKTYYHSKRYAKRIIIKSKHKPKTIEYYLRENNKWVKVNEGYFMMATCKESIVELEDKLSEQLRKRVEKELKQNG